MTDVLATAADEPYGYHALNLIGSVKANSDVFDAIVVYDLGLSPWQRTQGDPGVNDVMKYGLGSSRSGLPRERLAFRPQTYADTLRRVTGPRDMRVGFDATSLTAASKGIARFQREFLHAAAVHGLIEQLDVFVPEQPDEDALPEVEGWRYHRVPTRPMIVWEQLRLPRLARGSG